MKIHADFECGNIRYLKEENGTVYLTNEMRGTKRDSAYYWAFCVEGAAGKSLRFNLDLEWVGPYGAAVSHDLINWHWSETAIDGATFAYDFSDDENCVYFAHDLLYTPTRLASLANELGLEFSSACRTLKGRDVPCIKLGGGSKNVILSARHHACESSGSYALEGVIREYVENPIADTSLFIIPMVDFDGVVEGEHGKDRDPHDHNRDYVNDSIYPETRAIMDYAANKNITYAIDFHAPSHRIGRSNRVYIVRKFPELSERFDRFSHLLEKHCGGEAMTYEMKYDVPPNTGWNKDDTPTFSTFFNLRPECKLALTLEVTHYGTEDNKVTSQRLINTGRAFCRALDDYTEQKY
jgi:hypothetical protein